MIIKFSNGFPVKLASREIIENTLHLYLTNTTYSVVEEIIGLPHDLEEISIYDDANNLIDKFIGFTKHDMTRITITGDGVTDIHIALSRVSLENKLDLIIDKVTAQEKQVTKIEEQLNPTVNLDTLSLDELKQYKIKKIGQECSSRIHAGVDVETSLEIEHFSYTEEDQINLKTIFDIGMLTQTDLPYHADGKECRLFTFREIISIYAAEQINLTTHTTKCNMLNTFIRRTDDREKLKSFTYDINLPDDLQDQMNLILGQTMTILNSIIPPEEG